MHKDGQCNDKKSQKGERCCQIPHRILQQILVVFDINNHFAVQINVNQSLIGCTVERLCQRAFFKDPTINNNISITVI